MTKKNSVPKAITEEEGEDTCWLVWEKTPPRILALRRVCFLVVERKLNLERHRLRQLRRVRNLSKGCLFP